MKKIILLVMTTAFLSLSVQAHAQGVTVELYKKANGEDAKAVNKLFLTGVSAGLTSYSAYLMSQGKSPAFCVPATFALTGEQAETIMLRWAKKYPSKTNWPVSMALMAGLMETFPCTAH
ncbi:MAG: hypothetical protein KGL11_08175 [Alphaproteobacteria bacterium]|nr:hypothetical protein [Alphaproteobacteria bacterium]